MPKCGRCVRNIQSLFEQESGDKPQRVKRRASQDFVMALAAE
jgi:hypothetical protein